MMESRIEAKPNQASVGFLGSGQLARMMGDSAIRMGLVPEFLGRVSESSEDQRSLDALLRRAHWIVFENEFVSVPILRQAAIRSGRSATDLFFPSLSVIETLQNKLRQKELLRQLGLPTAPFIAYPEGTSHDTWLSHTLSKFNGRAVFKWASHGYDGKGVCLASRVSADELQDFCATAWNKGLGLYAEAEVEYVREVAMVAIQPLPSAADRRLVNYPLVCSEQSHGVCRVVTGPAIKFGVSARFEQLAIDYMRVIAQALSPQGLVGAFALEAFETRTGELWINELAPRVHNTGHYTMDAAATSQFENHLRAVIGRPLGAVTTAEYFAMRNILGPVDLPKQDIRGRPFPASTSTVWSHDYRKDECRPLRKLGHLNAVARTSEELTTRLLEMNSIEAQWVRSLHV